jgi:hypothetical protein
LPLEVTIAIYYQRLCLEHSWIFWILLMLHQP